VLQFLIYRCTNSLDTKILSGDTNRTVAMVMGLRSASNNQTKHDFRS